MNTTNGLSRRDFLGRSLRYGAAGIAASCIGASTIASESEECWKIGIYTRPWAKYDYRVALDAIVEAVNIFVGDIPQADDMTLFVIKRQKQ